MTKHSRRNFIVRSATGLGAAVALGSTTDSANAAAPKSSALPRRQLGKTGWLISIVGFGGGSQFLSQSNPEVVEKMIERAIELGVNYFDTAFGYTLKESGRESYRRYGKFLVPKHRNAVRLSSKLQDRDAEGAKRNLEITLKELGTDHLDVLHFHALASKQDVDKILAPNGAAKVYRKMKEEGVIKAIGITGHASGEVMIDAIRRIEPDCVMCPINPAHSGANSGGDFAKVIPVALERGLGMLAMKTTARNALIGKNGVSAEQLVRYALNMPISAAVIGMPGLEVLESCAAIARDLPPISEEDRKSLESKLAKYSADGTIPYLAAGYMDGHQCLG